MFYRIRLDLSFTDKDPVDDILDKVRDHLENAVTINPGTDAQESGFILTEKCYHDEDPTRPCDVLEKLFSD